jgi:hypothetical protein
MIEMPKTVDSFAVDIKLRHPSYAPAEITGALGMSPWGYAKVGQETSYGVRKSTVWMCHFREGIGAEAFTQSLEQFLSFLDASAQYLESFRMSGGEIEVEVNQTVGIDDGILFNLHLDYDFLKTCGERGISLRVQAWSANDVPSEH